MYKREAQGPPWNQDWAGKREKRSSSGGMIPGLKDAKDARGWILDGLDPHHCQEALDKGTERSEMELAP